MIARFDGHPIMGINTLDKFPDGEIFVKVFAQAGVANDTAGSVISFFV